MTFHDYIKNHTKYGRGNIDLKKCCAYKIDKILKEENFPNRCIRFKLYGKTFGFRTDYNLDLDHDIQAGTDNYVDIFDELKPMEAKNLLCFMYFEFRDKYNEMNEEIGRLKQEINGHKESHKAALRKNLEYKKRLDDIKEKRSHAGRPAISVKKRERALELREQKMSFSQISKELKISTGAVHKIINEQKGEKA